MTLGELLATFSHELVTLVQNTDDATQKDRLRDQLDALHTVVGKLVDANVKRATKEYAAATKGVQAGTTAIQQAEADIAKVAQAIDNIAKALDVLEQLAKKVGAA